MFTIVQVIRIYSLAQRIHCPKEFGDNVQSVHRILILDQFHFGYRFPHSGDYFVEHPLQPEVSQKSTLFYIFPEFT